MQWLTPMIGFFHSWATVRATTATDTRGAAIPVDAKFISHLGIKHDLFNYTWAFGIANHIQLIWLNL